MPFASVNQNAFHQNLLLSQEKGRHATFSQYRQSLSHLCESEIQSIDSNSHCKGRGQILHYFLVVRAVNYSSLLGQNTPAQLCPAHWAGAAHLPTAKHFRGASKPLGLCLQEDNAEVKWQFCCGIFIKGNYIKNAEPSSLSHTLGIFRLYWWESLCVNYIQSN